MRALKKIELDDIVFVDIETSSVVKELEIDTPLFDAWAYKFKSENLSNDEIIAKFNQTAALYAEFGRIVCISVGRLWKGEFVMNTYNNLDEKQLILDFYSFLDKINSKDVIICGHAVKSFDIPYIVQRGIINNLIPHELVDTSGLKPWESDWVLDTKDLWSGMSFNKSSLIGITTALGLPSPKDDISGADVPALFWKNPEGNIDRISKYCEKDVKAVFDVMFKLKNLGKDDVLNIESSPVIQVLFDGKRYTDAHKREILILLRSLNASDQAKSFVILESIVSGAKGKKTKFTKDHIKELKEILKNDE